MHDFTFILNQDINYSEVPYHPDKNYNEFNNQFKEFNSKNLLYMSFRALLQECGLDKENAGTEKWNPFREFIKDGDKIVIKPNLVLEEKGKSIGTKCIATQGDMIRPILDYIYLLQKKENIKTKVTICDVPILGADFETIVIQTGIRQLVEYYNINFDLDLEMLDLRNIIAVVGEDHYLNKQKVEGDPLGYSTIHIENSFLNEIVKDYKKFGVSGYGFENTSEKHSKIGYHYYQIPNTVLDCDLFINLPKLKTHKKAGITIALKNLIGIVGDKSWIPHFRKGSVKSGGDEFDNNNRFLKSVTSSLSNNLQGKSKIIWNIARGFNEKIVKKYFREDYTRKDLSEYERKSKFLISGDWYGNDTIWRPVLDLNYILRYADRKGQLKESRQRKYICFTDGVIAGEGDGPLEPLAKHIGLLSLCFNPIINDICLSRIMGFDNNKIPQLKRGCELLNAFNFDNDINNVDIFGFEKLKGMNGIFRSYGFNDLPNLKFLPPPGWKDHIELYSE